MKTVLGAWLCLVALRAPAQAPSRPVQLNVMSADGARVTGGILRLDSATGSGTSHDLQLSESPAKITLPLDSRWVISVAAPGWWMAPQLLYVEAGEHELTRTFSAWRTGYVRTHLKLQRTPASLPKTVTLAALSATEPRPEPKDFAITCEVTSTGNVGCEMPIGVRDIAVRSSGFAAVYYWNVRVRAGVNTDLGESVLVEGASVAGWAKSEGPKLTNASAQVWGLIARGIDPKIAKHLNRPLAEGAVNARGFFQLRGLREGTYRLVIKQAGLA